jgi:hypothetical protein
MFIPSNINTINGVKLTDDLCRFIGYFIADGNYNIKDNDHYNVAITMDNNDPKMIDDITKIINDMGYHITDFDQSEHGRKAFNEYRRNKLKNDPVFRMAVNLRLRLRAIIKQQGGKGKYAKMLEIVGMDWVSFKKYIENKFKPGMTWDNYGSHWHLDHIKAITKFDLLTQLGQKQSCHYTNLQPLWALENLKKGNR